MLKELQIIHLIKTNNCPFWKLSVSQDTFSRPNIIANYNADDVKPDALDETAIDLSIKALQSQLSIYKEVPGLIFSIVIRPAFKSNGDTVLGPYVFTLNNAQVNTPLNGIPNQGQNMEMMGFVPKSQLSDMMELMNQKQALLLEKTLFERDRRDFEEERKEAIDEIKDQYKEYSKISNAAKSGSEKGVTTAVFKLAEAFGFIKADANLGEIEEKKAAEPDVNDTPEGIASLKVAELLIERKLSVSEILKVQELVTSILNKKDNNGTEAN